MDRKGKPEKETHRGGLNNTPTYGGIVGMVGKTGWHGHTKKEQGEYKPRDTDDMRPTRSQVLLCKTRPLVGSGPLLSDSIL